MLGRLLRTPTQESIEWSPQKLSQPQTPQTMPTFVAGEHFPIGWQFSDDVASRRLLFGTSRKPLNSVRLVDSVQQQATFNATTDFRLLIVQDRGEVMARDNYHVLLDTGSKSQRERHSLGELKEYMLGSPVHKSDTTTCNKLRTIGATASGLPECVLITRVFYVNEQDLFDVVTLGSRRTEQGEPVEISTMLPPTTWENKPLLSLPSNSAKPQSTRYAIGVVVPLSSDLMDEVIVDNWHELRQWFMDLQLDLEKSFASYYEHEFGIHRVMNRKIIVPLINTTRYSTRLWGFFKLLNSLTNVPRLFLAPLTTDFTKKWFIEVMNWIDLKDGGMHGNKFLVTLMAQVLARKTSPERRNRLVIMSSNIAAAQKLVFIISGLLHPRSVDMELIADDEHEVVRHDPVKSQSSSVASTITNKGWNIPAKAVASTVDIGTSQHVDIVQPSSLNSVHYLSTSLSSNGSWIKSSMGSWWKGYQQTPVAPPFLGAGPVTPGPGGPPSRSSSTTSLYKMGPTMIKSTPSPSGEMDEYPWSSSPRVSEHSLSFSRNVVPNLNEEAKIKRTPSRLQTIQLKHDELKKLSEQDIDDALDQIMGSDSQMEFTTDNEKHVTVMDVAEIHVTEHQQPVKEINKPLPLYTSFLSDYTPVFGLQACPISSELESKILKSMADDVRFRYKESCTLFVSLRNREIKEITMNNQRHPRVKKIFKNEKMYHADTDSLWQLEKLIDDVVMASDLHNPAHKDAELNRLFQEICRI